MKMKIGLYAGSFKPFHVGHLDIVKQAIKVFDKVSVAKGINPEKENIIDDYRLPTNTLSKISVGGTVFDGLLIDVIKEYEEVYNADITLIRGLRSGADLDYEQNFAAFLRGMKSDINIVAFYCHPEFRHISSSALRAIRQFSEEEYWKYVVK